MQSNPTLSIFFVAPRSYEQSSGRSPTRIIARCGLIPASCDSFISSSLIACATGRPFKISIFILPCTFMLNLCQKSRTFMPILLLFTLPCPLQSHKCCPQAHFPVPAFHQHAYSYHLQQPYFS